MTPKPQILICGTIVWAHAEVDQLRNDFTIIELEADSRSVFLSDCQPGNKYSQIVGIYRHNYSAEKIGIFDEELIKGLPSSVKFICHNGAGYDQIDVAACTKKGIAVSNTPGAVDDATATTAMYLVLGAMRGFSFAESTARTGKFKQGVIPGRDLEGKVLGIIGMGGIGRALARRAIGFSMRILYHNRRPVPKELLVVGSNPPFDISPFVEYCPTLEDLLARSDAVSLNLPLNANTAGSFGRRQFEVMKRGAVLVNTARGAIVDEKALLAALASGHLRGAGLDVFPREPEIDPRLRANLNCTILPHVGTETKETQHKMEVRALVENLASAMSGKGLKDRVPEQV